jgi:hypothetical protein
VTAKPKAKVKTELVVLPLAKLHYDLSVVVFHLSIHHWVRQLTTTKEIESIATLIVLVWLLMGKGD